VVNRLFVRLNQCMKIPLMIFTFAISASSVSAAPIGPDCSTCHDTSWDLTYTIVDAANFIYDFTLTATGGANLDYAYIDAVAIKVASNDSAYQGVQDLLSAPGGTNAWKDPLLLGTLNASACNEGSAAGFACTSAVGIEPNGAAAGGTDQWVFRIDLKNTPGLLLTGIDAASIKARFTDADGNKVGSLLSEDMTITPVPEPATLLLMGGGAVAAAFTRRRRKTE
jgi:PEP-CTERM motif-containing protein